MSKRQDVRTALVWLLVITLFAVGAVALQRFAAARRRLKQRRQRHGQACASCSAGSAGMLPLMDPQHNIREIIKQILMLEDHCAHGDAKYCVDCITKHALAAEALAEEAITLDTQDKYAAVLHPLPGSLRHVQKRMWQGDITAADASKEYRAVRKTLMPAANDMFDSSS